MAALTPIEAITRHGQITHNECQYTVVDVADNSTTVYTGPCILYGLVVTTVLSAHALPVLDGATNTVAALAASAAVGTTTNYAGIRCDTSLVVDPNDSATGRITVIWRKVNAD